MENVSYIEKLRRRILDSGWPLIRIAERAGLHPNTLKYVRARPDQFCPRADTIEKLEEVLREIEGSAPPPRKHWRTMRDTTQRTAA